MGKPTDTPSDAQFTRLDWRPTVRRATYPRVRDWGGQKKANPLFLAHRAKPGAFGQPGLPKCRHCAQPAMRGLPVCKWHGGAGVTATRRPYARAWQSSYGRNVEAERIT
jgi:hypothetical protein